MTSLQYILVAVLIGCGATLTMDLWLVLLKRIGVPVQSFAMIGRWIGHMTGGIFMHAAISKSQPIRGELWIGWITHYAVGIVFALLLTGMAGTEWLRHPSLLPALTFGLVSAAAPLFLMQPAMGAGMLARRTPAPFRNSLRSIANHLVFGIGLYIAAQAAALILAGAGA